MIFKLRDHQKRALSILERFSVIVMHRRAGKSVFCVAHAFSQASQHLGDSGRYHYVGPSQRQTRAIAWAYAIKMADALPGCVVNKSDLKITFPSGSTLELLGVQNADSLRGRYSHGIVLDEAQLMAEEIWTYIIRPLLADRKGWAILSGTPAGLHNLLGMAFKSDEFAKLVLPVSETDALDADEVEGMRRSMSVEAFAQEMECDFSAALQGAYYSRELHKLHEEGRFTTVRRDDRLPVVASLDLGHRDLMPVIWAQEVGTETRIIHHKTYQWTSIPEMVADWKIQGLPIPDQLILPHDSRVRELGSGKTREEVFRTLGIKTQILPNQPIDEGIEACRQLLAHCWIDDRLSELVEALGAYRSEYDAEKRVYKPQPLHDWSSHHADAFRYLAMGRRKVSSYGAPQPRLRAGVI